VHVSIHQTADEASAAAADRLAEWLVDSTVRTVMVAGGTSPLDLYRRVAERRLDLGHLTVFALDEYVGVSPDEPRTCGNLLRAAVADAWAVPPERFHAVSPVASEALASVRRHEELVAAAGGLDVVVLGLGRNGHLGFNEPGSAADSAGRLVELEQVSVEANQEWFGGRYAPSVGVTAGLRTVLSARRALLLAFGAHKASAVAAMVEGPVSDECPASLLRPHPDAHVFLDERAAAGLSRTAGPQLDG
jgi:glucosamine-6-phosphate deaminase